MDFQWVEELTNQPAYIHFIAFMRQYGFIAGIALPMIEAIFPPLPLALIVTLNVYVYGFWKGYLYSWIGTCIGSLIIYYFIQKIWKDRFLRRVTNHRKVYNTIVYIQEKGLSAVFILLTFPFTPSIIICSVAALSGMNFFHYATALLLGKLIMIFTLSFIGYHITAFLESPLRSVLILLITGIGWILVRRLVRIEERYMQNKKNKD